MITFTKVKFPYSWLGNMAPYPVEYDGQRWRTTEALFQVLRFKDTAIREAILEAKSPLGAKMIAKRHKAKVSEKTLAAVEKDVRIQVAENPFRNLLRNLQDYRRKFHLVLAHGTPKEMTYGKFLPSIW